METKNLNINKLLPCPFCKNTDLQIVVSEDALSEPIPLDKYVLHNYGDTFAVSCSIHKNGCGSESGYKLTVGDAVELWNSRHLKTRLTDFIDNYFPVHHEYLQHLGFTNKHLLYSYAVATSNIIYATQIEDKLEIYIIAKDLNWESKVILVDSKWVYENLESLVYLLPIAIQYDLEYVKNKCTYDPEWSVFLYFID